MAVDHKIIADDERHNPKGFNDASPASIEDMVYTATGGVPTFKFLTAANLATDAVTTNKITNLNVTLGKMATNSVDNSKVVAGSLGAEKFQTGATEDSWVKDRYNAASEVLNISSGIDTTLFEEPTEESFNGAYSNSKVYPSTVRGVVLVSVDYRGSSVAPDARIIIYRNSTAIQTYSKSTDTYTTEQTNVTINIGDVIRVLIGINGTTGTFVRNFTVSGNY